MVSLVRGFLDPTSSWPDFRWHRSRQSRSILVLALLSVALSYVWLGVVWTSAMARHPTLSELSVPGVMLIASCLAVVAYRRPSLSTILLIGGLAATQFLWRNSLSVFLGPVNVCLSGLLLSRNAAVAATLLASLAFALPRDTTIAMWATCVAFWLASDHLYVLMQETSARQERAFRLERELLTRREELRRLNDSLRTAYGLLERTNRELADARDEAEEARRLKNQFAATISHELRTPLNLILGFTEVMHTAPESYGPTDLPPELRGDIREVYQNTRHLLDLVDDVLDLSRIEQVRLALVPEDSDVLALIREAAATVAGLFRGKSVELVVDLPPALPRCTLDRTRIRQVLINLLTNATRFTEEGEVRVQAAYDDSRREVVISVSDTGPGIPDSELQRVFQPFHQAAASLYRHKGGSGLGLAICRTFVHMHGGRIWAQSRQGEGSRFSFALPVRATPPSSRSTWRPAGVAVPAQDSLVVLDAEGDMARVLERALPQLQVFSVSDVAGVAKAAARQHPKAIVAFTAGHPEDTVDRLVTAAPWPGLPLILCQLRDRRPLESFSNVREVLIKPASGATVLNALGFVPPTGTVVLADDDEGMTRLVRRALSQSRPALRVLAAHDGDRALELIRAHRPDAVLLDLAMPGRDGLSVLEAMADEAVASIPVVVLTAMDLKGAEGSRSVDRLVLSTCTGLSEMELARYVESVAAAARPRYVGQATALMAERS